MRYELLEHTADAKFRAYGGSLAETFGNAIVAMTAIVVEPEKVAKTRTQKIRVAAPSLEALLFNLLDEVLFLMDTQQFIASDVSDAELKEDGHTFIFTVKLHGDDVTKYGGNLKAVTYSEMIVEAKPDGYMVQAVIDI